MKKDVSIPQLKLIGKEIYLRKLSLKDATKEYRNWLNDPEVNQYLELRFSRQTVTSIRNYIRSILSEDDNLFLAIIRKDTGKHIGNIKLGPINRNHKLAEIGIVIGDKSSWGKGYATESIKLLSDYAFENVKLHKVIAGAYADNIGSIKAFLKAGFFREGRRRKHFFCNGRWVDEMRIAKINKEYR